MVDTESFTINTLMVIDIQILQGLTDKSMLDLLQCAKHRFSPLKLMINIHNDAIFIKIFQKL